MIDPNTFTKMMPGLDFMRNLLQGADQTMPAMGQWVAPTLDPEELGKRINDLKAVHFWLEQNANMLGVTIQALEVQRMTLSTLQTMNLPMAALREAMTLPDVASASTPHVRANTAAATPEPAASPTPAAAPAPPAAAASAAAASASDIAKPPVDPMLWWGALTQQFTELATKALHDGSAGLAKNLAAARDVTGAAASASPGHVAFAAPKTATKTIPKTAKKKAAKKVAKKTVTAVPRKRD